jgi:sterol desaturase/sphingolipid hydroxylase (fatty acid hydroxylase superfamily)
MTVPFALDWAVAAAVGFFGWGLVEYAVHGVLSHRLRTFVSPLHWGHHRTPAAVFTSPLAWIPAAALVHLAAELAVGRPLATGFTTGLLAGFARYEWLHWRLHFREPRNARERTLRDHHLAHHFVNPRAYYGVTTRLWDRVFASLPATAPEDYRRVSSRPPLSGPSNLRAIWSPRTALGIARDALQRQRRGR